MKGGFYALRSMKLPFILFIVVCLTLYMWCEKTSFLAAFMSTQNGLILPAIPPSRAAEGSEGEDIKTDAASPASAIKIISVVNDKAEGESPKQDIKTDAAIPASDVKIISVVNDKAEGELPKQDNQTCNYARGKWVEDDARPFYSGSDCKQWLSGMWSCRLTQRTDFAYENFRWQPLGCEMEEFEGDKFLRRMRNKTVAFIGDSLGRQQFQSLMCMITSGKNRDDVMSVGSDYGLVKARGSVRPDGWAYRFLRTNTTILYYWSACLCGLEPIDKKDSATQYAMHLDRPPAFLKRFLSHFDVLVLNTGHHWNRGKFNANRWVMHLNGAPITDTIGRAKNITIHSIVKWVDSQLPNHPGLSAFYRSMSPRHFFHGDWNTGGTCDNTNPMSKGKEVLKDTSDDRVAAAAVKGTNVKLLDITAPSELRDEAHMSRYSIKGTPGIQDCLHWCLPGVPDTWNELLFAQLEER